MSSVTNPKTVPAGRIRTLGRNEVSPVGRYVLYWMTATRRTTFNFALDRALELARELDLPLLVLEPLSLAAPHPSPRFHAFVLDGMRENERVFAEAKITYWPYVEAEPEAGRGLVDRLASEAAVVVADDAPLFWLPTLLERQAARVSTRFEAVDSCGLVPLDATRRVFTRAHDYRRWLQKILREHLEERPNELRPRAGTTRPLRGVSSDLERLWPRADAALLEPGHRGLTRLALPASARPVPVTGGSSAARAALRGFLRDALDGYAQHAKEPRRGATSELSAFLHFGHLSVHEVFWAVADHMGWSAAALGEQARGKREGWWGMGTSAEAFLDQLLTWRGLSWHAARHEQGHDRFESVPAWARSTLAAHAADPRPHLYRFEDFDAARTHDPLWNAAQSELRHDGRITGYLRMLWGKKILEWSASPEEACDTMFQLNDTYALDGRDPNSASSILWVLGKYDRPFGPERAVFGKVRCMTSRNTRRKLDVENYVATWGPEPTLARDESAPTRA